MAELKRLLDEANKAGKNVVVASGSFNPMHADHVRYLQSAAKQGDILVVLIKGDEAVRLKNKERPVIPSALRAEVVAAMEGVDYAFVAEYEEAYKVKTKYDNEAQMQWLAIFEKLINEIKPAVWVHEDSAKLGTARERLFGANGIRSVVFDRGARTSSTAFWNTCGIS